MENDTEMVGRINIAFPNVKFTIRKRQLVNGTKKYFMIKANTKVDYFGVKSIISEYYPKSILTSADFRVYFKGTIAEY